MQLLVSVRDAGEALDAVTGGARIIDAKEPSRGALAAVTCDALRDIVRAVGGRRPVSVALGDAVDATSAEREARTAAAAGATFVKVGLAGVRDVGAARTVIGAVARGAGAAGAAAIAVAYADWERADSIAPLEVAMIARAGGASGLLLDTADKSGPSLRECISRSEVERLAARVHRSGLVLALAGKLASEDIAWAHAMGADIAGVRGAACDGGRVGRLSAGKVAVLASLVDAARYSPNSVAAVTSSALTTEAAMPGGSARAK